MLLQISKIPLIDFEDVKNTRTKTDRENYFLPCKNLHCKAKYFCVFAPFEYLNSFRRCVIGWGFPASLGGQLNSCPQVGIKQVLKWWESIERIYFPLEIFYFRLHTWKVNTLTKSLHSLPPWSDMYLKKKSLFSY